MSSFAEIQRLIQSRCALTVQAASKSGNNDGSLVVIFQVETTCSSSSSSSSSNNNSAEAEEVVITPVAEQKETRLVECELSPAQLFSILAVLEEAHAKLLSKSDDTG